MLHHQLAAACEKIGERSRASSLLRSVTHCSWDTTGWFVMLDLPMVVFMMCSWLFGTRTVRAFPLGSPPWESLPLCVETGYAIGSEAESNKIVVIPAGGGN